ncbi:MAG: YicC family protein [Desulfobulbus propionicus]|nr:MAG: YicC family protein [Desulfobulbus propionicus]
MPQSMTGFGRGEATAEGRTWVAEIRTVNHRFLDQRVVIPRSFGSVEEAVKKQVATRMDRGRVDITLSVQGQVASKPRLTVDEDVAGQYYGCLQHLIETYELKGGVTLSDMLTQRDIINLEEHNPDLEAEWELIAAALDEALTECDTMRSQEGAALKVELLTRLDRFAGIVASIESNAPEILAQRHEELKTKLFNLLDGIQLDEARLAQEAAILADKCDITEEVVRLGSHIEQFKAFLDSDEPVGRRLDFLLQEFLREVNTLASKISNASVAHLGVEMKNEIEKLREQVQNLE